MENINSASQQVKIHINPKFKNAHINPNFLQYFKDPAIPLPQIKIHINPKFLTPKENEVALIADDKASINLNPSTAIVNTRRKLIRANTQAVVQMKPKEEISEVSKRLITLTRNKLVRQKIKIIPLQKTISKPSKSRYKIKNVLQSTFKIDRRSNKSTSGISLT
jgi:type III secretory pathway component EscV